MEITGPLTIAEAGCGPSSLAILLAGLNDNSSITPQSLIANATEYYKDKGGTSVFVRAGVGTVYPGIYNSDFLEKYYNCKSTPIGNYDDETAFAALQSGKCIVGYEVGHLIGIAPVSADLAAQGYNFYVLDSCKYHNDRGYSQKSGVPYYHTAPFKSRLEFLQCFPYNRSGRENVFEYKYIIEKLP